MCVCVCIEKWIHCFGLCLCSKIQEAQLEVLQFFVRELTSDFTVVEHKEGESTGQESREGRGWGEKGGGGGRGRRKRR